MKTGFDAHGDADAEVRIETELFSSYSTSEQGFWLHKISNHFDINNVTVN